MIKPKLISKKAERIFAIGDIHGCFDELRMLLEFLLSERKFSQNDIAIFVGDYIDRGLKSKEVIEYLLEFKKKFPDTIFLKGNHEDMLLQYLTSSEFSLIHQSYLANGGVATLKSYNIFPDNFEVNNKDEKSTFNNHLAFFSNLEICVEINKFVFVHAGLNPLKDYSFQSEDDLLWIRENFINYPHTFEKTIIFGHTPYDEILFDLPYKIGIDTGLVYGNKLSCIELTKGEIFQIEFGSDIIILSQVPEIAELSRATLSIIKHKKKIRKRGIKKIKQKYLKKNKESK